MTDGVVTFKDSFPSSGTFNERLKVKTGDAHKVALVVFGEDGMPLFKSAEVAWVDEGYFTVPPKGDPRRDELVARADSVKRRFNTIVYSYEDSALLEWSATAMQFAQLRGLHGTWGLGNVDVEVSRPRDTQYALNVLPPVGGKQQQRWRSDADAVALVESEAMSMFDMISVSRELPAQAPKPPSGVQVPAPPVPSFSDAVATRSQNVREVTM